MLRPLVEAYVLDLKEILSWCLNDAKQ